MRRVPSLLFALGGSGVTYGHEAQIFDLAVGDDWCTTVNEVALPGDIIRLAAGEYSGGCHISRTPPEEQDEYTMVMSLDPSNPARLVYDEDKDFMLRVEGDQVMVLALEFGPVPAEIPVVEILGQREIWLRYNHFSSHQGIGVQVSAPVNGLHVVENSFEEVQFPLEIAAGEGSEPVWVSGNLIRGSETAVKTTGTWKGWFLDNVVVDVENGLVVEEAQELSIKGNWLRFQDHAVRIDAGSAVLENNIVDGAGGTGVAGSLGSEGQAGSFEIYGNDFLTAGNALFDWPNDATESVWVANRTRVPLSQRDGRQEANRLCASVEECWTDPTQGAYYPPEEGLQSASVSVGSHLMEDFCGRLRPDPLTIGSLEPACAGDPERFEVDFKTNFRCTYPDLSGKNEGCNASDTGGVDSGADTDSGETTGGCACSATRGPGGRGLLLLSALGFFWLAQRRERGGLGRS